MLKIVYNLRELDFARLMAVYEQSNRENGAERFPELPQHQQLLEAEQDFYQYLRECFFTTRGACYALWVVEDAYVSALRLEPYGDGLLIAALETAPDCRSRGYAKALLRAVLQWAGEQRLYSHVHKRNIPSLRTHESCGFSRISEHAVYADGSVLTNSCTFRK